MRDVGDVVPPELFHALRLGDVGQQADRADLVALGRGHRGNFHEDRSSGRVVQRHAAVLAAFEGLANGLAKLCGILAGAVVEIADRLKFHHFQKGHVAVHRAHLAVDGQQSFLDAADDQLQPVALLAQRIDRLDKPERERVERPAQLADFVVGSHEHAVGVVAVRHAARHARHPLNRPDEHARLREREQCGEHDGDAGRDGQQHAQLPADRAHDLHRLRQHDAADDFAFRIGNRRSGKDHHALGKCEAPNGCHRFAREHAIDKLPVDRIQQLNGAVIRSLPAFRNVHGGAVALHQRHLSLGVDKEHRRVGQVLIQLYDIAPRRALGIIKVALLGGDHAHLPFQLIDGVGLRVFISKDIAQHRGDRDRQKRDQQMARHRLLSDAPVAQRVANAQCAHLIRSLQSGSRRPRRS